MSFISAEDISSPMMGLVKPKFGINEFPVVKGSHTHCFCGHFHSRFLVYIFMILCWKPWKLNPNAPCVNIQQTPAEAYR